MKQSKETRAKAIKTTKERFQKERVVLKSEQMFGYWKVIGSVDNSVHFYSCICTGCSKTERILRKSNLLRGETKSCGCQIGNNAKKTSLEKYGVEHFAQTEEKKIRTIKTLQEKYGVSAVAHIPGLEERKKRTNLEKYGTEYHMQTQDTKEKMKKHHIEKYGEKPLPLPKKIKIEKILKPTCIETWGVPFYLQSKQGREQRKKTNLEKYGVEFPTQSEQVQQKIKKANLQKYGVESYLQTAKAKELSKKGHFKKFGVENYIGTQQCTKDNEEKALEKYGVKYYSETEECKQKIKQTNLKKYGVEWYPQTKEQHEKAKQTMMDRYGVTNADYLPHNRMRLSEWVENNPELAYTSKTEKEILEWIKESSPNAKKYQKEGHQLDVYIPNISLGVEFNGLFWHNELQKERNYHLNKTVHFKNKGIRVIHIWEHEWKFKQEQVKSFLLSALGKNENKIGARKCKVIWSDSREEIEKAHNLLDSTHIQGHTKSTKYVANAYYQDELIATATFGKHHRSGESWVLSRFTTKTNYTIQGILSKITKLASGELGSDIISWADYRLSQGNGYEKAGWVKEELLKPDYFYYKTGYISKTCVISKQSRQKKLVKTPEEMTEHEHAKLDGLVRVYDCGKIRYKYKHGN